MSAVQIVFLDLELVILVAYAYVIVKVVRAQSKVQHPFSKFWSVVITFNLIFIIISVLAIALTKS